MFVFHFFFYYVRINLIIQKKIKNVKDKPHQLSQMRMSQIIVNQMVNWVSTKIYPKLSATLLGHPVCDLCKSGPYKVECVNYFFHTPTHTKILWSKPSSHKFYEKSVCECTYQSKKKLWMHTNSMINLSLLHLLLTPMNWHSKCISLAIYLC